VSDYVIVPKKDLEALETARKLFFEHYPDAIFMSRVTESMWKLTHRKYKEVDSGCPEWDSKEKECID